MPKTPRRPLDFYPTPQGPICALRRVLDGIWDGETAFDPAAGEGHLLAGLGARLTHGIEIDPDRATKGAFDCADALSVEWPDMDLFANPPFGLLDRFWLRVQAHREEYRRLCAVFTPVAWWSAEKRRSYATPDIFAQLGWRPTFHRKDGPAHKGSQDFCWSILLPEPSDRTEWIRLEKPSGFSEKSS